MSNTDFQTGFSSEGQGAGFGRGTATTPSTGEKLPFIFNGTGKEYFGIWIVNILLTLVTLGIYSAWAKVRNKRYFNGNLELDNHRFDYHAEPMQILKGRIIVVGVLIAMNLLSQLNPFLGLALLAFYLIALPWVIVVGLRFNANMTSYRGVRFHFVATKWEAFKAFILWPFAAMFTLGALIPFASRASARFLGNNHFYGRSQFSANPPLKPYYAALGLALVFLLLPAALVALAIFLAPAGGLSAISFGITQIGIVVVYIFFILAFFVYAARSRNIGFGALALAPGHRFESTITVGRYAWILISNAFLTIITIGLYIPWAKVRMARYLADNTFMMPITDLDQFTAGEVSHDGVASGEFLDIEGLDFGF